MGLQHVVGHTSLQTLSLIGTSVTDTGLKKIEKLTQLTVLTVGGTGTTEASFDTIVKLSELSLLHLGPTLSSNAGLARLAALPKLSKLIFGHSDRLTDDGLEHLVKCQRLKEVSFEETKVTEAGVKKLAAARPDMKITWDGKVIGPKKQ
ncbi:Alanyl-tRNA synthetase [Fimbriiglobus ruber]|uniref:Alanyl-tRNA synthetase n=1 Tax=Fimbriiglobus ruber TaxID=1908690 RepID=A0A225DWC4_9BACT|nr:Alanyl-tRNA synthetase [Fimbriiglobus ruber]